MLQTDACSRPQSSVPNDVQFVEQFYKIHPSRRFASAAASIEGFHYALNFISKVNISSGQHILVIGGTGAIGSAMIQILKDRGCTVTAVCIEIDFQF